MSELFKLGLNEVHITFNQHTTFFSLISIWKLSGLNHGVFDRFVSFIVLFIRFRTRVSITNFFQYFVSFARLAILFRRDASSLEGLGSATTLFGARWPILNSHPKSIIACLFHSIIHNHSQWGMSKHILCRFIQITKRSFNLGLNKWWRLVFRHHTFSCKMT